MEQLTVNKHIWNTLYGIALHVQCQRECDGRGLPQEAITRLKQEHRLGVNQVKRAVNENSIGNGSKIKGNKSLQGKERGPTFSDM